MSTPLTPQIHAAIQLQGNMLQAFLDLGMQEELARTAAEEALHLFMTSKVVDSLTKHFYEELL